MRTHPDSSMTMPDALEQYSRTVRWAWLMPVLLAGIVAVIGHDSVLPWLAGAAAVAVIGATIYFRLTPVRIKAFLFVNATIGTGIGAALALMMFSIFLDLWRNGRVAPPQWGWYLVDVLVGTALAWIARGVRRNRAEALASALHTRPPADALVEFMTGSARGSRWRYSTGFGLIGYSAYQLVAVFTGKAALLAALSHATVAGFAYAVSALWSRQCYVARALAGRDYTL